MVMNMTNPSKSYLESCIRENKMSEFTVRMTKLKTDLDRSNVQLRDAKASIGELQKIHDMQMKDAIKFAKDKQKDHDDAKEIFEYGQQLMANKDNGAKCLQIKKKIENALVTKNIAVLNDAESYFAKILAINPEEQKWISVTSIAVNHYVKAAKTPAVPAISTSTIVPEPTPDKRDVKKKKSLIDRIE